MGNNSSFHLDANHGFGLIPEKRKYRAILATVVVNTIAIFVSLVLDCSQEASKTYTTMFILSLGLVGIIFGEFVKRFCLMFEEYSHLDTRYDGSKKEMFLACFRDISIKRVLIAGIVALIIIAVMLFLEGAKYFKREYIGIILSYIGSGQLLPYLLGFDTLPRVQLASLLENDDRTIAHGFAWAYYYGYLSIILPGLTGRIDRTQWKEDLCTKKLFILLPRDCQIHGKLTDEDNDIEQVENGLIEHNIPRGGIPNRSYSNVVYKVKKDESQEEFFVLAEYAAILQSMPPMSENERNEQVKLFVRTLKSLLKDSQFPNCCRFVPYSRRNGESLSKILINAIDNEKNSCEIKNRDE